jgi:four helix bundle protein
LESEEKSKIHIRNHKDLEVWKKSIELVKEIYQITRDFPKDELYGLTSQIRRSAVSIPSNISEGAARHYKTEFKQFLYIALGSLSELETQLIISNEIEILNKSKFEEISDNLVEIRKMLLGLIKSLQ